MRRMLIVDDEETIRWALSELFMQDGWLVHCAGDGEEAARMVAEEAYDYMITDLKMPGRSGVQVIREARARKPEMGVTVLTGYATVEMAVEAVRLGVWDFVTKPCSAKGLKARVDEFLGRRDGRRVRPSGPPSGEELDAFAAGEGTPLLPQLRAGRAGRTEELLRRLRQAFADVGFDASRATELTQFCVETLAAFSEEEGTAEVRAVLRNGRLLVGIGAPGGPAEAVRARVGALRSKLRVEAGLLERNGACTVMLSEAI